MNRVAFTLLILVAVLLASVGPGCDGVTPTSTPAPTATSKPTITPQPTPTSTPRPTPTRSALVGTATPKPSSTRSVPGTTPPPATPYPTPFPESRRQHYRFAHSALPTLFHDDPEWFINTLAKDGNPFLRFLWDRAGQGLSASDLVASDGLGYEIRKPDDVMTIVLITLPPPQATTEAHFVALVYCPEMRGLCFKQLSRTRVITLEYNWVVTEQPVTILGEWMPLGEHRNYGLGPEPTLEAFLEAVRALLARG